MARIFSDGAEMGDMLSWDSASMVGPTTWKVRSGAYSHRAQQRQSIGYMWKNLPERAELFIRVALNGSRVSDYTNHANVKILSTGGAILANYYWRALYNGVASVNNVAVANVTSPPPDTWQLFEFRWKSDPVNGVFAGKLNGFSIFEFNGNTGSVLAGKLQIELKGNPTNIYGSDGSFCADDIAVNDTLGLVDNSWCGDGKIIVVKPNANGSVSQLVNKLGTSDDNYTFVDEIPSDGDGTYVAGDIPGKQDLYNFGNISLSVGYRITRVWPEARAKDAAGGSVKLITKPNNIIFKDLNPTVLGMNYGGVIGDQMPVNPETGLEWTDADVNALQAGIEIQ